VASPHRRVRYWVVANANGNRQSGLPLDAKVAGASIAARNLWNAKPGANILGVDDGMANRMVRLEALGNGQVPSVAALAWAALNEEPWPTTDRTDCVSTG
jgi:DNA (cytosine-5)-methyltransferase 1